MRYDRPDDAPDSWAADTMRKHLLPINLEIHGDFSGMPPTATGRLEDIEGDVLVLDCGPGYERTEIEGRDITAIVVLAEEIDRSDELRGV